MQNIYPKRLIEVDLPIKRISAHARREKSIRPGHISTLHVWWARRPLAACRAVICAALWFDPADPLCPSEFREEARMLMREWIEQHRSLLGAESFEHFEKVRKDAKLINDDEMLRTLLLDFIADFANWDNSTNPQFIETSRALTDAAHLANGGAAGTRPLVVDPFAGGGSIPLEALRVGADTFASDLNPVAVLLNKVLLNYVPKHGPGLSDEVRKWGMWIKNKAEKELADFYSKDPDGATPIAYLWARTIICEGPNCGIEVPLLSSLWLSRKAKRSIALQIAANHKEDTINFQIIVRQREGWKNQDDSKIQITSPSFDGTLKGGSVTCPRCNYTTPAVHMRKQLKERHGGTNDARLICVVTTRDDAPGRFYRLPTPSDYDALQKVDREWERRKAQGLLADLPHEPTPEGKGKGAGRAFSQRNYGIDTFDRLYTRRQALTLTTLARIIRSADVPGMSETVRLLSALALGRVNDLSMSLCRWLPSLEAIAAANGGQNRMPVVLDFIESNPFGGSGGDWLGQIDWIARVAAHLQASALLQGTTNRAPAQIQSLPDDFADAFVTDPPYYDAFPYSDLSDFFFIWLKRALGVEALDYSEELVPKDEEVVVYDVAHGNGENKNRQFFQREMTKAFRSWRAITKCDGIGVIVFANKTTAGWESLIQSIIDSGWIATASWPIDTERPNRQRAIGSAALGSSVHVVCRPRENANGSNTSKDVGDWRDVLQELPHRIHQWLPRLDEEGVVGADAIFACLGPALEIFSRHSRVEKANGEVVELKEFLQHVWSAVANEALTMVFKGADATGFEEDARLTAMWLWTLFANVREKARDDEDGGEQSINKSGKATGFFLEYDAARKIAQGLGARLESLPSLVQVTGDKARLLPVIERTRYLFGKNETFGPVNRRKKDAQAKLFDVSVELEAHEGGWGSKNAPKLGNTILDRVHQSMILFAAGRGDALRRFLVDDAAGTDERFWRLAQALVALYPKGTDERRWIEGVMGRKKGLGF